MEIEEREKDLASKCCSIRDYFLGKKEQLDDTNDFSFYICGKENKKEYTSIGVEELKDLVSWN